MQGTCELLVAPDASSGPKGHAYKGRAPRALSTGSFCGSRYGQMTSSTGPATWSTADSIRSGHGCPGNAFHGFDSLGSEIFPVTIAPAACAGDCDADGRVTIDQLITGVRMALGEAPLTACPAMDADQSGGIQVDDLVAAVTPKARLFSVPYRASTMWAQSAR